MADTPRILYVAPCWPAGKPFGLRLRTAAVAQALQKVGQLDCVVVQPGGDDATADRSASARFNVKRHVQPQPVGPRSIIDRLRCAFDAHYIGYQGHVAAKADREAVEQMMADYDLIWLHHLHTANYLARWHWPKSFLDVDDVPSTYLESVWRQGAGLSQRLRAGVRMLVARRRERLLPERFSALAVCSEADRKYLGGHANVHVIPNGFTMPTAEPVRNLSQPGRIGFIGKFGYAPNDEGVRWFLAECWPRIRKAFPELRFRIIGLGGEQFALAGGNVDALGWVEDPAAEIATWAAMLVPLRMGSGTRLKIAEGFSRKCPIVSTSFGAQGYDAVNGRELFLADTATAFADACIGVVRDPVASEAMAARAWQVFQEKWTWDAIEPRIRSAAEDCLRRTTTNCAT